MKRGQFTSTEKSAGGGGAGLRKAGCRFLKKGSAPSRQWFESAAFCFHNQKLPISGKEAHGFQVSLGLSTAGRPAAGHRTTDARPERRRRAPGPSRRHRLGQDLLAGGGPPARQ